MMRWFVLGLMVMLLTGCGSDAAASGAALDVPTISAYFGSDPLAATPARETPQPDTVPTNSPYFQANAFTPPPTRTRRPTPTLAASKIREPSGTVIAIGQAPAASRIVTTTIYDEQLNKNWTIDFSTGMDVLLGDKARAHQGNTAIAITPLQDYGKALFTVREGVTQTYPYSEVLGVTFWINSGEDQLNTDALVVTIIGSNDYGYYLPNDKSVATDNQRFFSETRLYYLNVNRDLPPNTWLEITLWLDSLPYDPLYKNVTGIYLKNDAGFRQTFYVDQIELLMAK